MVGSLLSGVVAALGTGPEPADTGFFRTGQKDPAGRPEGAVAALEAPPLAMGMFDGKALPGAEEKGGESEKMGAEPLGVGKGSPGLDPAEIDGSPLGIGPLALDKLGS